MWTLLTVWSPSGNIYCFLGSPWAAVPSGVPAPPLTLMFPLLFLIPFSSPLSLCYLVTEAPPDGLSLCPAVGLVEPAGVCLLQGSFSSLHSDSPSANNLLWPLNTTLQLGKWGKCLSVLTSKLWKMDSFAHCTVTIQDFFMINRRGVFFATGNYV